MEPIEISTDLAALAVFDPDVLAHRVREKDDWWRRGPLVELDELRSGKAAIVSIGHEGNYRLAFRQGEPSEAEQALISGTLEGLGLHVESGQVFVGVAERLPGDGRGGRLSTLPGTGVVVELEPGDYAVRIAVLHWRHLDDYYDEDNEIVPDAPPDFLVLVGPRAPLTFPEPLPTLLDLLPRHEAKGSTSVPSGTRRRRPSTPDRPRRRGGGSSKPSTPSPYVIERSYARVPEELAPYSTERVRAALDEVVDPALRTPPPLDVAGIELIPRDQSQSHKEVDLAALLKKTTTIREQLRVLEAKLNSSDELSWAEKAELQVYVTRAYEGTDALLDHLA